MRDFISYETFNVKTLFASQCKQEQINWLIVQNKRLLSYKTF